MPVCEIIDQFSEFPNFVGSFVFFSHCIAILTVADVVERLDSPLEKFIG